jgi:phosphate:Na+ symporter
MKQVSRLQNAFDDQQISSVEKVILKRKKYSNLETHYRQSHLERIQNEQSESLATHEIHMELMDMLKQINLYIGDIAKTLLGKKEEG